MDQAISKYVDFGTMRFADFASSKQGTVAKFFLSKDPESLFQAGKSLKSACTKVGSSCVIKSTRVLINTDETTWVQSHVLEAEITVSAPKKDEN